MDRQLRKILTKCIREMETGALDVEGCLRRHPESASELRPHLELWSGLNAAPKAQPSFGGQQRGQNQLLGALSDMEETSVGSRRMIPAFVKAAAVAAAAVLLVGGAAGASAALGGPDVADEVLSTVGITSSHDGDHGGGPAEGTLDTARDATVDVDEAQPGLDTAERGAENSEGPPPAAEEGLNTAAENAAGHEANANDAASDGLNTAAEARGQAGVSAAADHPAGEADEGLSTAENAGADAGASEGSVPDTAPPGWVDSAPPDWAPLGIEP